MSTFVLIHGASHGGWCWYKVVAALEKHGHTVLAPDLPGHGKDKTPVADVTLQRYVDCVCKLLDTQREPVILVGHSMGGGIITQVAEERPDRIKWLVYLAGAMPQNGQSMFERFKNDTTSASLANFVVAPDQLSASFREEGIREAFYEDCSEEDIALARLLLVPQAMEPISVPVKISEAKYGRVPRAYIECLQDRALTPPFQKLLYTGTPCQKVISINTSHSPFFSAPEELARHLMTL
jgi:pimeloyl-ACP methyl ester carboxylesterase